MAWRFFHEISDCFQKVIQISAARALYKKNKCVRVFSNKTLIIRLAISK